MGRALFSLKGCNKPAQGNALGKAVRAWLADQLSP